MARPRKPDTEALEAAIRSATDLATETGEPHYVLRDPFTVAFHLVPRSELISPLPGDQECLAIVHPDGRLVYL